MMSRVAVAVISLAFMSQSAIAQLELDPQHEQHKLIIAEYGGVPTEMSEHDLLWSVPTGVDSLEVGDRLVMTAPPRTQPYEVELIAHIKEFEVVRLEDGTERRFIVDARIRRFKKSFRVLGTPPTPPDPDDPSPPDPDDPDDPDDDFDEHYGLVSRSAQWVLTVPANHRNQAIEAIAENFAKASKSTAAPNVMLDQLREANLKVLPNPSAIRSAWLPFFTSWSDYVTKLYADGTLANLTSSHQLIFDETRRGLEHVIRETGK